jgi:hypothetical protein
VDGIRSRTRKSFAYKGQVCGGVCVIKGIKTQKEGHSPEFPGAPNLGINTHSQGMGSPQTAVKGTKEAREVHR